MTSRRRQASAFAAGLVVLVGITASCQALVTLEAKREPETDAAAGVDAEVVSAATACAPFRSYRAPTGAAAEGEEAFDLVFGEVSYSHPGEGAVDMCPVAGFDLDDRTTCFEGESAKPTACTTAKPVCDDPEGVDNAAARLFSSQVLQSIPEFDAQELLFPSVVRGGARNLIMRVSGYNGAPDDPDVTLTFFLSSGIVQRSAAPLEQDASVDGSAPEIWDGKSLREWYVDPGSIRIPGTLSSVHVQATGFVTGRILVVTASELVLPTGADFELQGALITGELRRRGGAWHILRGRAGARITSHALIGALAGVPFRAAGKRQTLCDDDNLLAFASLSQLVCGYVDINQDGLADGGPGSDGRCASLSLGLAFTAVPAVIGPVRDRTVTLTACTRTAGCR